MTIILVGHLTTDVTVIRGFFLSGTVSFHRTLLNVFYIHVYKKYALMYSCMGYNLIRQRGIWSLFPDYSQIVSTLNIIHLEKRVLRPNIFWRCFFKVFNERYWGNILLTRHLLNERHLQKNVFKRYVVKLH